MDNNDKQINNDQQQPTTKMVCKESTTGNHISKPFTMKGLANLGRVNIRLYSNWTLGNFSNLNKGHVEGGRLGAFQSFFNQSNNLLYYRPVGNYISVWTLWSNRVSWSLGKKEVARWDGDQGGNWKG